MYAKECQTDNIEPSTDYSKSPKADSDMIPTKIDCSLSISKVNGDVQKKPDESVDLLSNNQSPCKEPKKSVSRFFQFFLTISLIISKSTTSYIE